MSLILAINNKAVAENIRASRVLTLFARSLACCWLTYFIVSLKPKNQVKQQPYLSNTCIKVSKLLTVVACDVTGFYAKITFCSNSFSKRLFKIVFLLETTFIFPQHSLSCEERLDYPDFYWLSAYLSPFVGVSTLSALGAWKFLSMVIIL